MKTVGNTGIAQQENMSLIFFKFECVCGLDIEMKPFLWNYGMFVTHKVV